MNGTAPARHDHSLCYAAQPSGMCDQEMALFRRGGSRDEHGSRQHRAIIAKHAQTEVTHDAA
jgi:hypothetical protein